jgi:hypothetical protein
VPKRRDDDDGLLVDLFMSAMHLFRMLPLWAAIVAAPTFFALFVWAIPAMSNATGSGTAGYGVGADLVRAFSPIIGWFLGGMTLLGGLIGTGERWFERRKQERLERVVGTSGATPARWRAETPARAWRTPHGPARSVGGRWWYAQSRVAIWQDAACWPALVTRIASTWNP